MHALAPNACSYASRVGLLLREYINSLYSPTFACANDVAVVMAGNKGDPGSRVCCPPWMHVVSTWAMPLAGVLVFAWAAGIIRGGRRDASPVVARSARNVV